MSDLIPFNFNEASVRGVLVNGEPHLVAKDVATALGYSDPTNAIKLHCRGVAKYHPIVDSLGRTQQARVISEADVMRLIVSSKLPAAEAFERKVFEDILPTIRKHGGYLTPEATEAALNDPDFIISLATKLKDERAKRAELEKRVEEDQPKVLFANAVATSNTTILVGDLAKILRGNGVDIGANRLFERLREDGYLIKRKGSDWNMPTQYAMDLELFKVKETAITHSDGHVTVSKTPKITGKGQAFFVNKYAGRQLAA